MKDKGKTKEQLILELLEARRRITELESADYDRKQAKSELYESQQMLRVILDTIPARVFWKDNESSYLGCNKQFAADAGLSSTEEVIKKSDFDLSWAEQAAIYREYDREVINTGCAKLNYEQPETRSDGTIVWLRTSKMPFSDVQGNIKGVLGIYEDITEQKKAEEFLIQNEERYRALFENTGNASILIDADTTIKLANSNFEKLVGFSKQEMEGKLSWTVFIVAEDLEMMKKNHALRRKDPRSAPSTYEFRINNRNGELKNIILNIGMIPGTTDSVASCTDITEIKASKEALQESEQKLSGMADNLPGVVYQFYARDNGEMGLYFVSGRSKEVLGLENDPQHFFQRFISCVASEDRERLIDSINDAVRTLSRWDFEGRFIWPTGEEMHIRGISQPERREHEVVFNGVILDITDRKMAEEALRKLNEGLELRVIERTKELETANNELKQVLERLENAYNDLKLTQAQMLQQEKMASIGQLAAGVAHEINNPMGFISSNLGTLNKYVAKLTEYISDQSEILSSKVDSETQEILRGKHKALKIDYITEDIKDLIKESLEGTERVKKIVQDLKSFSRVDQMELINANINECIESTINVVWNELKYKATMQREYGEIPFTKCYPQQLGQVFINLLVNAAHAIEKQGVITVRTWNEDNSIYAAISDTGHGIEPLILSRIFEPFFTTKDVGKGTGLGLSITYDIIKKHNGEITVHSEIGKGTTFIVRIPLVEI